MKRKIAVFISDIYGAMIRDMQEGINAAAIERGVKVIYFASFSDGFSSEFYDQYVKYDEGDIVSFKLPDLSDFDGAILITSSFAEDYKKRVDKILIDSDIPVINLGGQDDRFYSIINHEEVSFGAVVEHVCKEHGCKDIYHVAGRREASFTYSRIDAYKETLGKYGLEFSDDKIYFGTLWRDCGYPAVDYILNDCRKRGKTHPDAIVCANDYTAIGVIEACKKKGFNVPGDIIVTGFDGVEAASLGFPSITTSEQPFHKVGREAVYTLESIWDGVNPDKVIYTTGELRCNQSCGCQPIDMERMDDIRQTYSSRMGKMEYLAQSTTNMILSMSNASTLEECFHEVEKNAMQDTGFNDFLLCLAPDWDKQRVVDDSSVMQDEQMRVVAGFHGDKIAKKQTFNRKNLLPSDMLEDSTPYYIFSLHHLQYYMGYVIVNPVLQSFNQLMMKSWLVNLGAMLENWRVRRELNVTVDRLENLYNRDMLTGLYNRRGYDMHFNRMFKDSVINELSLAVMIIDMDDLKYVNDTFGHAEGDYSLCTIAEALTDSSQNGEICLRTGGDEFVVLALGYTDDMVDRFKAKLRGHISEKITNDKKPYPLQVSIGASIHQPFDDRNENVNDISEKYLKLADEEMYKEKITHKRHKRS